MEALTQRAHLLSPIVHLEDVGAARRRVSHVAAEAGLDAATLANAELVVTELATNLLRHAAPGGHIVARPVDTSSGTGLEVLAVDRGPGIGDLGAALGGRVHDPAGLGLGLSAVRRMSTEFDVYTGATGTVVLARLLPAGAGVPALWSGVSVSHDGVDECGDAWAVADEGGRTNVLVVDGLGHGPEAAAASRAAVAAFAARHDDDLESMAQRIHAAMRGTRGGAAALCRLDPQQQRAEYVGVGNVAGRLVGTGGSQALVSLNGTLGTDFTTPRIRRMSYTLDTGASLVMSSDGIREGFDVAAHPGLFAHDPLLVAAMILGQCGRGTDDATVVVVRPVAAVVAA